MCGVVISRCDHGMINSLLFHPCMEFVSVVDEDFDYMIFKMLYNSHHLIKLIAREQINRSAPNFAFFFFEIRKRTREDQKYRKHVLS
jgi:hypothetical protein